MHDRRTFEEGTVISGARRAIYRWLWFHRELRLALSDAHPRDPPQRPHHRPQHHLGRHEYEALGDGYRGDDEITADKITGAHANVIKPRIAKEQEHQLQRTRTRAEVFTPSWLVNRMNDDLDALWFSRRDAFNAEGDRTWQTTPEPAAFSATKGCGWHAYVESPRLEITCGEAPFVCSRYDTVTGKPLSVPARIGFLDRNLLIARINVFEIF